MAKETQSEDAAKRFEAIGFDVQTDRRPRAWTRSTAAFERAKNGGQRQAAAHHRQDADRQGHPRGRGHAEGARRRRREVRRGGAQGPRAARRSTSSSRAEVRAYFAAHEKDARRATTRRGRRRSTPGRRRTPSWPTSSRPRARTRTRCPPTPRSARPTSAALLAAIPEFPADTKIATRKAGQDVLQPLAAQDAAARSAAAPISTARR